MMRTLSTALVACALVACGGGSDGETLAGTFTVMEAMTEAPGDEYSGEGGYADLSEGSQVVVKDGEGKTLATSRLQAGRGVDIIEATMGREPTSGGTEEDDLANAIRGVDVSGVDLSYCRFAFEVPDVPKADFYAVSVGRRGEQTYSYDEMAAKD